MIAIYKVSDIYQTNSNSAPVLRHVDGAEVVVKFIIKRYNILQFC